jgi:hypothetical protein
MEDVSKFNVHLVNFSDHLAYFTAIWYIFPRFGTFLPVLVHFYPFWYIFPRFGTFLPVWVHFPPFWYIFTRFGTFLPVLVHFYPFWYVVARKIWQPWSGDTRFDGCELDSPKFDQVDRHLTARAARN